MTRAATKTHAAVTKTVLSLDFFQHQKNSKNGFSPLDLRSQSRELSDEVGEDRQLQCKEGYPADAVCNQR
jgi:hypothetical protein